MDRFTPYVCVICMYVFAFVHVSTCMSMCVYMCKCICALCMCVCGYVCMCACVCIYVYLSGGCERAWVLYPFLHPIFFIIFSWWEITFVKLEEVLGYQITYRQPFRLFFGKPSCFPWLFPNQCHPSFATPMEEVYGSQI